MISKNALLLFFVLPFLFTCTSAPEYQGPKSDHFDGERFFNRIPMTKTFWDYLGMRIKTKQEDWPKWIDTKPQALPKNFQDKNSIKAIFINHSTVLLNIGGTIIITDPTYAKKASPFSWYGPKRVHLPGIKFDDLPKIDVILISHNHYDHLDIPTIKRLAKRDQPLILAGLGNNLLFKKNKISRGEDLDWNQTKIFKDLKITFVYSQHWSARGLFDRRKTLWGSFIINSPLGKVYFSGDTGFSNHFLLQGKKYGPFDLAFLPIGGYEARYFMKYSHLNPDEAVQAHLALKSKKSIGIHFGTFQLTNEKRDQPKIDLNLARNRYKVENKHFFAPQLGKVYNKVSP